MKQISLSDITLRTLQKDAALSFREKVEIVKALDRLCVNEIETSCAANNKADALLLQTAAPLLKNSTLCCACELSEAGIDAAVAALRNAKNARLVLRVPASAVQMEYVCGCKPKALLELLPRLISHALSLGAAVELAAVDATRSEPDFLRQLLQAGIDAGASVVTICDTAGLLLPEEYAAFLTELQSDVPALRRLVLGAECADTLRIGAASLIAAAQAGASLLKLTAAGTEAPALTSFASILRLRGDSLGLQSALHFPVLQQETSRISAFLSAKQSEKSPFTAGVQALDGSICLRAGDDRATVAAGVAKLGYDLSEEDMARVYESFRRNAGKKEIGSRELDALVANAALQVAPTYRLRSYVCNSSNVMSATAQIELEKDGAVLEGISLGDGPIDAAFLAIENILGHHFDLDDFQIQSVTEGREAMGEALVKLRSNDRLYAGRGISTDIIGASIRAYLNALNKICYEEAQA